MNENKTPSAAGDAAQITEAQVVAFFKAKLEGFQAKMPGYATISFEIKRHPGSDFEIEWRAYHHDRGNNDRLAGHSLECATGWHFDSAAMKRRANELREEAAQMIKQAEEIEAALVTPPAPSS